MSASPSDDMIVFEKNRLEALTDGIFAFAMTLLVTSIILPRSYEIAPGTAGSTLQGLIPDFIHYCIAFFILAGFWIAHHAQFKDIRHLNRSFLSLSILGLFFVTLVPFSTSFVGDYPEDILADIVFELNLMLLGLIFFVQWFYAARRYRFVSAECTETRIRQDLHRNLVIPLVSGIGIILALSGSQDSTMIYLLTPLAFYAMKCYIRRSEKRE